MEWRIWDEGFGIEGSGLSESECTSVVGFCETVRQCETTPDVTRFSRTIDKANPVLDLIPDVDARSQAVAYLETLQLLVPVCVAAMSAWIADGAPTDLEAASHDALRTARAKWQAAAQEFLTAVSNAWKSRG